MANVSYNPQSLVIDSVRAWVVSGSIDYTRTPRSCWRERIQQARDAGLNTILVPICWSHHEIEPAKFNFKNASDLRHFIELIHEANLNCILRVGPFIGAGRDMGGLPPWLLRESNIALRQSSPPFLQAVARWYNALFAQLKGLLATDSPAGPIQLVQVEHRWLCHHPAQGDDYLKALHRYIHEAGCQLPIVHANNFHQPTLGAIEAWADGDDLFATTRQMRAVQPDAPRLALAVPTGPIATWGNAIPPSNPDDLMRDMARVAAAGGAFNLEPFGGETNFQTDAGAAPADQFYASEPHPQAPVSATGSLNPTYRPVKRLATFLSQYSNLMSHLHPDHHPAVCDDGVAVTQQTGSQGSVVFFIRAPECADRTKADVITPDGQRLAVHFGHDPVAWVVLDTNLDTLGVLNLTNLRPWARVGAKVLVFFGPPSTNAIISLNNTLHTTTVPKGDEPRIINCGEAHLVILNEKQIDAAFIDEQGLHIGAQPATDPSDPPTWSENFNTAYHVDLNGKLKRQRKANPTEPIKKSPVPKLSKWLAYAPDQYTQGASPRYAKLKAPTSLEACGANQNYGWYRLTMSFPKNKKTNILIPDSGDRLHLYQNGAFINTLGVAPGATTSPIPLQLEAGQTNLVILADVLGRADGGLALNRPRGVCGSVLAVKPIKLPKLKPETDTRIDPFTFGAYLPDASIDDRTHYPRHHVDVKAASKEGFVLTFQGPRPRAVILFDDQPVAIDPGDQHTVTLHIARGAKKGAHRITFAYIEDAPEHYDPAKQIKLFHVDQDLADQGQWHYAKWTAPVQNDFTTLPQKTTSRPTFFHSTFKIKGPPQPLLLELAGLTKGQIWLNDENLSRYFIATHAGKKVPPQNQYYLPADRLRADELNTLMLFDEHGQPPTRCKLHPIQ